MIFDRIKNFKGKFLIDNSGEFSYEDLSLKLSQYSSLLDSIIKDDYRVVIYSEYNFHSISLLIYLSSFPINIVPLTLTNENEYEEKIRLIKPNLILTVKGDDVKIKIIKQDSRISKNFNEVTKKDHTGVILFTSGSTGKPKVLIQDLNNLVNSVSLVNKQKQIRFLILLMFDHIGGLNTLLNCILKGMEFVIPEDRNPFNVINLIFRHKVNVVPTTPTFLNLILMSSNFSSDKFESVKLITYGTERMSEKLLEKLNYQLPNVKFIQTFGTSETGILKTISKSSDSLYFKFASKSEFEIINNELFLKTETQIKKYLDHKSDNFKSNGWYATGDLVDQTEDGFLKIIGRKNDVINVGGLKVMPKEIEDVINSVVGVDDSTVYGEQNNILGQIVCANIYTTDNETETLKLKIKKIYRHKLEKFKIPVKFYFKSLKATKRGKKLI